MASIEKRILKSGERAYHITVCVGYGLDGKKVRRRTIYKPDPGMSDKQADKAAQKEAFRFEQQLEQGFVVEENQRFQEYAEYVMELKLRNGLKRSKFDLEKRRLKVDTALLNSTKIGVYETTTKTGNQRYIPLPEETFALLKRYRISQMEMQLANGDRWVQTDYVFTQSDGSPIRPDTITQWLAKFSKRKGLPHINPHAFRHTAASVLIAQGTDVVTVSKTLGHTKVSTTEDIYSHVIEDCKQQASNALAEVYFRRKTAEN